MLERISPRREKPEDKGLEPEVLEQRSPVQALELRTDTRRYWDGAGIEHIRVCRSPLAAEDTLWEVFTLEPGEEPLELLAEEELSPSNDESGKVEQL